MNIAPQARAADDKIPQVFDGRKFSGDSNDELLISIFKIAGGEIQVGAANRLRHLGHRQAVRLHLIRIEVHADFTLIAPREGHLRYPRDFRYPRLDLVGHKLMELTRIHPARHAHT